jgi:glutamyl-Q tRNA(Asp) synthetase
LGEDVAGADRLRVPDRTIAFDDRVMGRVEQALASDVGDFVLRRRDALFAYQLAVVVDDADQGITDVVRGADLLLSTPRQILLQEYLGYPTPRYLHIPVATHADGQKLSKQSRAAPIDPSRPREALANALKFLGQAVTEGYSAEAVVVAAAKCWNPSSISRQYTQAVPT